ncbi:ATP-binding protein [Desulfovibrio inopinatus]|uniref:sensor histidine kinase n=1 Tax=Desulfovibrio inopinatus TaxID=102109 RepID=UPI00068853B0|nr:ATP-binding protein [Desulfovibrio inopinatus]
MSNTWLFFRFSSIRSRLLLASVLLVIIPMLTVSFTSIWMQLDEGKERVLDRLTAVVSFKKSQLVSWTQSLLQELDTVMGPGNMRWHASVVVQKSPSLALFWQGSYNKMQINLISFLTKSRSVEEVFFLNANGTVVLSTNAALEGAQYSNAFFFIQGMAGKKTVSTLAPGSHDELSVVAAVPVETEGGLVLGVLAGKADLVRLENVLAERSGLGRTGLSYLIRKDGVVLTPTGHGLNISNIPPPPSTYWTHSQDMPKGQEYTNLQGEKVIGCRLEIPVLEAMLVVEQSREEAFATTFKAMRIDFVVGFFALMLAVGAGLIINKSFTKPLAALTATAAAITAGELRSEATVQGPDEFRHLSTAFNTMTHRLGELVTGLQKEVAERKKAQEATRESEDRFRTLVANIPGVTYRRHVDDDVRLVVEFVSDEISNLCGYPAEEFVADCVRSYDSIIHPEDIEKARQTLEEHIRLRKPYTLEYRILTAEGKERWVFERGRPVLSPDGELLFLDGVIFDETERKLVQEQLAELNRRLEDLVEARTSELTNKTIELEAANAQLRQLDNLKSILMTSVSHDIRTPLTSVLGYAKLVIKTFERTFIPLCSDDPSLLCKGERVAANLQVIKEEGERLTRLVNDFLDLSKIESGRMSWSDSLVSVEDMVKMALRVLEGEYKKRDNLSVSAQLEPDLPQLSVDPDRVIQVLVNLLHNAIKFTAHGSVTLYAEQRDQAVRISIVDTGIGLTTQNIEHIFDEFYQVTADTLTEANKGTGLGLSICKRILEHYHGRIWAESEQGKGATFHIEFPTGQTEV